MQIREILTVIVILAGVIAFALLTPKHGTRVYDCRLAEISPDFPLDVKEECRKLNIKK